MKFFDRRGLLRLVGVLAILGTYAQAQFSSNVQGAVTDPSGASIPKATITLVNTATNVAQTSTTDAGGVYHFTSLAPGEYTVSASAAGFGRAKVNFRLQTAENRDVAISLALGDVSTNVEVTTQAPLLDTADSRMEYTLDQKTLTDLPLSTRNPTAIIGVTPGVVGALNTQTNINNAPENFIDASASGRGENGNTYVVDGLDVTSNVRPGVVNLTPGGDLIQEVSVQTNTYSVEYGRGSGIETRLSTKYGTDLFHGFASEYYTYQGFSARGEYGPTYTNVPKLAPFHTNNAAFGAGGPILKSKKLFFFASYQPYLRTGSNYVSVNFEDPAFVSFAQTARPNSPELQLFQKYPVSNVTGVSVLQTASQIFGATNCNTAAYDNIPCATPVIDTASFNSISRNSGLQYSGRVDKYWNKDRVYVSAIRNRYTTVGVPARAAFRTTNNYYGIGVQVNETHTFGPNLLNEAVFAANRIEGIQPETGNFSVPVVGVTGLQQGFGAGFAQGDYYQHSYHWRDVVSFIRGSHTFKFGYEGWHGDDTAIFQGPYGQPTFSYTSLINFINSTPYSEGGLSYNPLSGAPQAGNYGFSETTGGAFAQDTWKVNKHLTVNYGLRYDNYGNPYPTLPGTISAPFFLGTGSSFQQQIANGYLKQQSNALNQSIKWNFAPRGGASWDIFGNGKTVFQAGFGTYRDQITVGNMADILKGNPPNWVLPTFFNDGSTAAPQFSFGTSNTYPYGFKYPSYAPVPYDSKGGQPGKAIAIGSVDPNVHSPIAYVWSTALERSLGRYMVASAAYTGSHGDGILLAGLNQGANQFGYNVNAYPGDLTSHTTCTYDPVAKTDKCSAFRGYLNSSFGTINYAYNTARSNYDAFIGALRGRFGRRLSFIGSYTRSISKDDASIYAPTASFDQNRFYGYTPYDVPNRISFGGSYSSPALHGFNGLVERVTGGWTLGGTVTYQSGNPLFISTNAVYSVQRIDPTLPVSATNLKSNSGSGDFSASGYNYDLPNVTAGATMLNSRAAYKVKSSGQTSYGVFPGCQFFNAACPQFTQPGFGQLGNETPNGQFRSPGFAQTDASIKKSTKLYDRFNLDLRLDAFNLFNQVNFNGLVGNLNDTNFGTSTGTHTPRYLQVGATVNF